MPIYTFLSDSFSSHTLPTKRGIRAALLTISLLSTACTQPSETHMIPKNDLPPFYSDRVQKPLSLDNLTLRDTPEIEKKDLENRLKNLLPATEVEFVYDGDVDTLATLPDKFYLKIVYSQTGKTVAIVNIVKLNDIKAIQSHIYGNFALFSGSIDDLTAHDDPELDLWASLTDRDTHGIAVRGLYYVKARNKALAKAAALALFDVSDTP